MGTMMSRKAMAFARKTPRRTYSCGAFLTICAVVLMTLVLFALEHRQDNILEAASSLFTYENDTYKMLPEFDDPIANVSALIQAIQKATERASGGEPVEFTELDRANWQKKNPCKSRIELEPFYTRRKFVKHVKPNQKWAAVLREYEKLHRTCLLKVDFDATRYFMARNDSTGCKFVVAGGPSWAGLGNKILPTLAVLLYAVLTQRVLLVPVASHLPEIICEPFEGSSWGVDPQELFTPVESHDNLWTSYTQFETVVDNVTGGHFNQRRPKMYAVRAANWCQPVPRFFCDVEQAFYSRIPWVYFTSCVNFLAKLFAIPSFRPVLEELFPDRLATTHMIRSVMYPSNSVWRRVKNVDKMYLKHADRRVGVQLRYRGLQQQFDQTHDMVNGRVLQCAWKHDILPVIDTTSKDLPVLDSAKERKSMPLATSIFITSLFPDARDKFSEIFHRNPPPSGDVVGVFQLTHSNIQGFGVEEDTQALSEVICLSFSDDLIVTPLSTFGGMAQAYGALTPYFLEYRVDNNLPPCERGPTMDPCYQDPEKSYICPQQKTLTGKKISGVVPYIKDCPIIDALNGLQLMTKELEDETADPNILT